MEHCKIFPRFFTQPFLISDIERVFNMDNERDTVVAVKGLIINDGKALIVKRSSNDDVGAGTWECAGGKIDFGESLEQALIREVKEEVGLEINVENLLFASTFNTNPKRQVVILTYLCTSSNRDVMLSEEHSEYKWCNRVELNLLLEQNILDDFKKNNVLEFVM